MIDGDAASRAPSSHATIEQSRACQRGVSFLLQARQHQAWWLDFQLAPGASDEWVTAYVGATLASCSEPEAREAARVAWAHLMTRQRPSGAWGYNSLTPGDADSTGWGVRLAEAVAEGDGEEAQRARRALRRHLREDRGIATYADPAPIRAFTASAADRSFTGWCGSQPCVTAAAAAVSGMCAEVRPYLLKSQRANGSWGSYWWCDDEYATALAAEALSSSGHAEDEPRVRRAVEWARQQVDAQGRVVTGYHPDGSAFATAWCLRVLLLDAEHAAAERRARVAAWLTGQQRADGSWAPSAYLRVPFPDDVSPWETTAWELGGTIEGSIVPDQCGIFTAATVLDALRLAGAASSAEA